MVVNRPDLGPQRRPRPPRVDSRRGGVLGFLCLVVAITGCEPLARNHLIVATAWSRADRGRIDEEFASWQQRHQTSPGEGPIRIDWVVLAPDDDLERLPGGRSSPDVLLGGDARAYRRLARAGRLAPLPIDDSPSWAVAREAMIRLVSSSSGKGRSSSPGAGRAVAFDDPRNDPISLAWAVSLLAADFKEGYSGLVRAAGSRRRIGRRPGSAAAAIERGEADEGIALVDGARDAGGPTGIRWPEGVAILAEGRHRVESARFLRFLAETDRAGRAPVEPDVEKTDVSVLVSELLGATLVDAQDELCAAWAALDRAGSPPGPRRALTEPPPWPPASIAKILERRGDQAMTMIETLAGQLTTDPGARAWLVSSWLSPPRVTDVGVLEELIRAADGRLMREPRFRNWLRAEWTAWARQRYRRVLRVVASEHGAVSSGRSPLTSPGKSDRGVK